MSRSQGGSVDSYDDPATGVKSELGVAAWTDYGNTTGFFERLNVPCKWCQDTLLAPRR